MRAPAGTALILAAAAALDGCGSGPPPLLAHPVPVFRGHRDLREGDVPWILGREAAVGVCLDVPSGVDTSQWEARLFGEPAVPAAVRLDTTLCFEVPVPQDLPEGEGQLCAELRDRYDGTRQSLPCVPFRFDGDEAAVRALEGEIPAALKEGDPVPRLDALAAKARAQGFPGLALRVQLIAAYTSRRQGTPASLAQAGERLRGDPSWLVQPAAARWAGQLAYERATLKLETEADLEGTWTLLREAERGFRVSGDRKWIAAGTKQAEVLSRAGAPAEAQARLRFGLAQCAAAPCDAGLTRAAENTLAWLIAADPDAGEAELAEAERAFGHLLEKAPADPLEHANLCLNLAIARQRRGRSPRAPLGEASGLLEPQATGRGRELRGWAELIEARQDLAEGRLARAAERGERLGRADVTSRLRALGASCAGTAHRRLGALPRALACFSEARGLHARAARDPLPVPLGPGQRAEDTYAAARVVLELGRPAEAWALLAELDGEESAPAETAPEVAPFVATLRDLERPASGPRRAQREALRTGTLDRMQEAVRGEAPAMPPAAGDAAVDFRAFPLDDEIVLLHRTAEGEVVLARRSPFPRTRLVSSLAALEDAIARQEPDDARWTALAMPLAQALLPEAGEVGGETTFAMHGVLQRVPLAALPLPSTEGRRWLAEETTVAWHPGGGQAEPAVAPRAEGGALFVVDPLGDLGLSDPGEALPQGARLLAGGSATREALREALPGSRWLHMDAHARFEPAFPDLSTVLLADGPLLGQELTAWAGGLTLANLSGCQTGRAPITADSGRFGILGLLARRGVPWVVGARAALPNALAVDFNRAFYGALASGDPVPRAYGKALVAVSRRHPASRWAVLLLLHAPEGGQTGAERTPSLSEGVR